jgi:hypothetical protein
MEQRALAVPHASRTTERPSAFSTRCSPCSFWICAPAASYFQIAAVALADMAQVVRLAAPTLNEACHLVRLWEIGGDPFEC